MSGQKTSAQAEPSPQQAKAAPQPDTLFTKAVANFRTAELLWAHSAADESLLNIIGYHLQQAVELSLKFALEQNGVEYPKTHSIEQLICLTEGCQACRCVPEFIDDHAEMFSQWEAKSRYIIGYRIEAKKLQRAMPHVEELLAAVAKNA